MAPGSNICNYQAKYQFHRHGDPNPTVDYTTVARQCVLVRAWHTVITNTSMKNKSYVQGWMKDSLTNGTYTGGAKVKIKLYPWD